MRAIVQDGYGGAETLHLRDAPVPPVADDEVLIRVRAAGVDPAVWHLTTGLPYLIRLAGFGIRTPKRTVPGLDLAGTVQAVGPNVARFRPGDEVFGIGTGAFAEYAVAPENKLAAKPDELSFEQAGVLAISGLTALHALADLDDAGPGTSVLIIGASGGVGSYAVQIAKAYGAQVTGVCRGAKMDFVRSLGADHVIDYTREDFTSGEHDLVVDIGGCSSLPRLRRALTPRGRLVIVGGESGGRWFGGYGRVLRAPLLSVFVRQRLGGLLPNENAADMTVLADLVRAGMLLPAIDRVFSLDDAPEALSYLQEGNARGKVVVAVAGSE